MVLDLLMSLDKGLLGCGLLCFLCSCSFMNGLVVVGWKVEGGRKCGIGVEVYNGFVLVFDLI